MPIYKAYNNFTTYKEQTEAYNFTNYKHLLSRAAECHRVWFPTLVAAHDGGKPGQGSWHPDADAMLLMDRVAHTGGDAAAAYSRQSRAESQFFRGVWYGMVEVCEGGSRGFLYAHRQQRNASSMEGAVNGG